jgi:hypothetical protein
MEILTGFEIGNVCACRDQLFQKIGFVLYKTSYIIVKTVFTTKMVLCF